jgi:hypothetical protein
MKVRIALALVAAAAASTLTLAPMASAAPSKGGGSHTPGGLSPSGSGEGNVGAYPTWSTVNCDGAEEWVFVAGGANPTDSSQCK